MFLIDFDYHYFYLLCSPHLKFLKLLQKIYRVKSGKFGRLAKFGLRPCWFHISIIGIKNKLTKQTVKIWISTVCKCMSEFT